LYKVIGRLARAKAANGPGSARNLYFLTSSGALCYKYPLFYQIANGSDYFVLPEKTGMNHFQFKGCELYRALKAGADPRNVVYSGVGKRMAEPGTF